MTNKDMVRVSTIDERIAHWVLAVSCLFALFTGLGFMFHHWNIIPEILGGYYAMKWLHIFSGTVFGMSLVYVTIMWWNECTFDKTDGQWIMQAGGYLWEAKNLPPCGMYNAGQKLYFWFIVVFGAIIVLSGLVMWNSLAFPVVLTRWAFMLHAMGVFVVASFFIVHLYLGTIGNPGTVQIMFSGLATRAYAEEHKGRWLAERQGQKPAEE
ncbi:MAG: formate dehydrogenase subunit gamma [Thermodesulfobacteriota bacterium]|nr:formate dehydrogenase subunit gamma [Thermodesulfobacteriota bacterium]